MMRTKVVYVAVPAKRGSGCGGAFSGCLTLILLCLVGIVLFAVLPLEGDGVARERGGRGASVEAGASRGAGDDAVGEAEVARAREAVERAGRETAMAHVAGFRERVQALDPRGELVAGVRLDDRSADRLVIEVTSAWHRSHYQDRLQAAQGLWELWAGVHLPGQPDRARISLVDHRGNEVGGSRVWAGSLIWVQD